MDYVIHVASSFPHITKKIQEKDVINPAVNGTMSILKASHELGIRRVIVTSSVATITDPQISKLMYDHEDTVDPDYVTNYYSKSKILAENSAWDFVNELNKTETPLEMSTIHPAGIIGPILAKDSEFTSMIIAVKISFFHEFLWIY